MVVKRARSVPSCPVALTTSMPRTDSLRPAFKVPNRSRICADTGSSLCMKRRIDTTKAIANNSGAASSRQSRKAMKMSGTMPWLIESTSRSMPGANIVFSCRTSLAPRAIRSPTRCRLWNVWLLPSRLR